jgi:hypothetical protein
MRKVKTQRTANKMAYKGAGAGFILVLVVGMLAASFIGGLVGTNIAAGLFVSPLTSAPSSRLIVGMSMLMGIMVSGLVLLSCLVSTGWFIGSAVDSARVCRVLRAEDKP